MDSVQPEANYRRPLAQTAGRSAVALAVGGLAFVAVATVVAVFNANVLGMDVPSVAASSLVIGGYTAYRLAREVLRYMDRPVRREGRPE